MGNRTHPPPRIPSRRQVSDHILQRDGFRGKGEILQRILLLNLHCSASFQGRKRRNEEEGSARRPFPSQRALASLGARPQKALRAHQAEEKGRTARENEERKEKARKLAASRRAAAAQKIKQRAATASQVSPPASAKSIRRHAKSARRGHGQFMAQFMAKFMIKVEV